MDLSILSANTQEALRQMTRITQDMIAATERETNSIALGDNLAFAHTVRNKQASFDVYRHAAQEFFNRQDEFFRLKDGSLKELCQLQIRLKAETGINMNFLEKIRHRPDLVKSS